MAQAVINIRGAKPVEDPEYRYKMPAIQGKMEGKGNGKKTVLPNVTALATSLHRDPGEVTKFFGAELGAVSTWDEETERAVVNGWHTTPDLQNNLFKYIEKFVLCPGCRLPETGEPTRGGRGPSADHGSDSVCAGDPPTPCSSILSPPGERERE